MKLLDKKTSIDATKLLIFMVVTVLATGLLVVMIGNLDFSKTNTYSAYFTDVTGVNKGDDVRIAGVKVGTVKSISTEQIPRSQASTGGDDTSGSDGIANVADVSGPDQSGLVTVAKLEFTVDVDSQLTQATHATIRYRNLVGQRYISLSQDVGGTGVLPPGSTIPLSQTSPALDLTVLFNGFKPLFQALSPDDINKLSYEIVQVFQGEGGTLQDLLSTTASVTNTLADRDQVIGQLIDNLDEVLDHLADRDTQLSSLIKSFRNLIDGLKNDRQAILGSLDGISDLATQTADLVKGVRPPFVEDIKQLRRFATITDRNKAELDRALQVLPIKLNKVGRTAIYGSWFNFYLCDAKGQITLPGKVNIPLNIAVGANRCHLG